MRMASDGTGISQWGAVMTRTTAKKDHHSAGITLPAPPKPLEGIVPATAKPKYWRIKPCSSVTTPPCSSGGSCVPDTHRSAGSSVVTSRFQMCWLLYQKLHDVKTALTRKSNVSNKAYIFNLLNFFIIYFIIRN